MKNIQSVINMVLAFVIIGLLYKGCQDSKDRDNLVAQLSQYKIGEKAYEVKRLSDSGTIATQSQTILTEREAIRLHLIELDDKMKHIQSQVHGSTETRIIEKEIPFIPNGWVDTTGWVRDSNGNVIKTDSISVPQAYMLNEKWFQMYGYVKKTGVHIDSLLIPNKFTFTVGTKKAGFLNLRNDAVVTVKNQNPYISVTGMSNVVIRKKKGFFSSTLFHAMIGAAAMYYIKK